MFGMQVNKSYQVGHFYNTIITLFLHFFSITAPKIVQNNSKKCRIFFHYSTEKTILASAKKCVKIFFMLNFVRSGFLAKTL